VNTCTPAHAGLQAVSAARMGAMTWSWVGEAVAIDRQGRPEFH